MLSYIFGSKKKEENADAELAMRDQLDEHGDFNCRVDGALEFEDYKAFVAIVTRQANRMFAPKKKELNEKKFEFFKEKNQVEYVKIFR